MTIHELEFTHRHNICFAYSTDPVDLCELEDDPAVAVVIIADPTLADFAIEKELGPTRPDRPNWRERLDARAEAVGLRSDAVLLTVQAISVGEFDPHDHAIAVVLGTPDQCRHTLATAELLYPSKGPWHEHHQ